MGGTSVGVASTVVDNAEASLEKYTQNTFNCEINTKIRKCIQNYPATGTCSSVTERSVRSPGMGGTSVGVASTVVDDAKASLCKDKEIKYIQSRV